MILTLLSLYLLGREGKLARCHLLRQRLSLERSRWQTSKRSESSESLLVYSFIAHDHSVAELKICYILVKGGGVMMEEEQKGTEDRDLQRRQWRGLFS